ncbi:MAG: FtsH protease activity modulator HflK [Burkholderiales bacterium]|jgi:membrane protease subunit HflK|nr:FtsH protease activity modulator HflK [Burkholderiales bacterium]
MSLNDPQWNNRGEDKRPNNNNTNNANGRPPDLDVIWQTLSQKLNDLFKDKGQGNRREPPPPPPRRPMLPKIPGGGMMWVVVIVVLLWLASGFYVVDAGSRGVVMRFGKYTQTTMPGLQWRLPFPVETVEVVPFSQVRVIEIGYRKNVSLRENRVDREATMLTDDENIVDILFAVQYDLMSAENFVFKNREPDAIVSFVAETAIREIVGKNKMDDVLYVNREQIAAQTKELMQKMLDNYHTGARVQQVTLQSIQPPDRVQAAFADAVSAGQDREKKRIEGQAYANNVVPVARGIAARLLEEANGYAVEAVSRAEGDASRFKQLYAEYRKAPEVTRSRLYIDAMQTIFSNTTKIMIDQKNGNNSLIYLPLDQLMSLSKSAASNAVATTPETAPAKSNADNTGAGDASADRRDALRNRDR